MYDAAHALAEAMASIDGKTDRFRVGMADRSLDHTDGTYPGYLKEAREIIERLRRRGFVVMQVHP